MCCLVYAKNQKRGHYTGLQYDIPARTHFDYQLFILKHALPGRDSFIRCILEPKGPNGPQIDKILTKSYPRS